MQQKALQPVCLRLLSGNLGELKECENRSRERDLQALDQKSKESNNVV